MREHDLAAPRAAASVLARPGPVPGQRLGVRHAEVRRARQLTLGHGEVGRALGVAPGGRQLHAVAGHEVRAARHGEYVLGYFIQKFLHENETYFAANYNENKIFLSYLEIPQRPPTLVSGHCTLHPHTDGLASRCWC